MKPAPGYAADTDTANQPCYDSPVPMKAGYDGLPH